MHLGGPLTPLRVFSATHPGLHHPRNEDTHIVLNTAEGGVLLAVCDGMGGMGRADEASRLAIEVLSAHVLHSTGEPVARLRSALRAADVRVREELCAAGPDRPGATAVLAYVLDGAAHVAWVGDSRAYLVRAGQVVARTRDHKLVEELVDSGQLTPQEAKESPLSHVVTRALGGRSPSEAPVQAGAFGYPWPLHVGDHLVLCSDGVCDLLDDAELAAIAEEGTPADGGGRLVETALLRGGHDNITVIVARWDGEAPARVGADRPERAHRRPPGAEHVKPWPPAAAALRGMDRADRILVGLGFTLLTAAVVLALLSVASEGTAG